MVLEILEKKKTLFEYKNDIWDKDLKSRGTEFNVFDASDG